ncbi:hypothetical protein BAnh1_09400 [Bartonella australis AUST/NH1]|uniref:Type I restriction enzyme R protein N-terminal domain-containing protein n=1 Tax=Bartonella australis (strain Aust/NH1) TaxID=1094489 RepID=M1NZF2_BARAA|nr:hypothetical protein [Bartonella australis]AGF74812.1 hypothetical protein BAnh1_09400 [Bartonella australis AUST/NH1]
MHRQEHSLAEKKDSDETSEHDIWLLNEEYQYYDYIASDKALSSIRLPDNSPFFEQDIDERMEELLRRFKGNVEENNLKRPDIAILNKEGAAVIVEFKAPGVSMDNHVADLMEYSQLLLAKSNGKLQQFYGYLIGSTLNPNRLSHWIKFSGRNGYFSTAQIKEPGTNHVVGELRSEILFYEDLISKTS